MRTVIPALIACVLSAPLSAQHVDSLRADSAFRRGDWAATAGLYGVIAARMPQQGLAWLRLGVARQSLGQLDSAVAPFERALALRFQVPMATTRLARLHALRRDPDRAFTYLEQLVPLRAILPVIVDTLSDFASLRADPRFAAIVKRMTDLRYPCRTSAQSRQFDFWVGDWNVTPFQAPPGRQVWVADGGSSLDYTGEFRDGAMRFEGWTQAPNGARVLQKLTFFPIHADTVRQLFETSADSGRTWQPGFDGRYVRRR